MQAMVKPGVPGHRVAYSKRDEDYLAKQGWVPLKPVQTQTKRPQLTLKKDRK